MNNEEVPQPHAADEYEVDLEKSNDGPVRAAARVVVHRIDNDAEVLRINAGSIEEAESLVAMVRSDLEELGHEEFLDRWGGRDGAEPAL